MDKKVSYLDKSYADKRRILREYSIKDEIRYYLNFICDELVCGKFNITHNGDKKIDTYFNEIIHKLEFNDPTTLWNMMKDFLIDGFIAMEIIWDDKKENILKLNRLRPDSLEPAYESSLGQFWYQNNNGNKRILLDSQVIYISYSSVSDFSETSYIESLMKPYNQMKILENCMIMSRIHSSTITKTFNIPVKGLSRQRAEEQIAQLIEAYSEYTHYDETTGELTINDKKQISFTKDVWLVDGDSGNCTMNMNNLPIANDFLKDINYFEEKLRKSSYLPSNDEREIKRFEMFKSRILSNFSKIILKPLNLVLKTNKIDCNKIEINLN